VRIRRGRHHAPRLRDAVGDIRDAQQFRCFENRGRDYIRRETVRHALEMGLRALLDE
jgi:hypothetical protein